MDGKIIFLNGKDKKGNMKKIFAIVFLLLVTILEAQTATVIKNVTSSLKPTGNSNTADLNYTKWNNKIFYSGTA